jgi:hypothetical protein
MPSAPSSPLRQSTFKNAQLSRILSNAAAPTLTNDVTFAAFKALPIDPARGRRENGSFYEPADELTGATSCKEAVDLMVDSIARACAEAGDTREDLVKTGDVVRFVSELAVFNVRLFDIDNRRTMKFAGSSAHDKCLCEDGVWGKATIMAGRLSMRYCEYTCDYYVHVQQCSEMSYDSCWWNVNSHA